MRLLQAFKMAIASIFFKKMRSFLTMLGVIIGVFAVAVLISLGESTRRMITDEIQGLGSNLIAFTIKDARPLTDADLQALSQRPGIKRISPSVTNTTTASNGSNRLDVALHGGSADYASINNITVDQGRFIQASDIDSRYQVAVIGAQVADKLYGTRDVVGVQLNLGGQLYQVVGVLEEKGTAMAGSQDNRVFIPMSAAIRKSGLKHAVSFYAMANGRDSMDEAFHYIRTYLQNKYQDADAYTILNQAELLGVADRITGTLTLMLGGIAGVSLLVGGIGIMNIMLVSVAERTREIGVRKAIGARKQDILGQFLVETVLITGIGGVLGILMAYGGAWLFRWFFDLELLLSFGVVVQSLLFSLGVGILFGIYPANKAARLHPIDALRYE